MAVASTLKVNGSTIARSVGDVTLERLLLGNPDGPDELQFTVHGSTTKPYAHRLPVTLDIDDDDTDMTAAVRRFTGRIVSIEPVDDGGPGWAYTAHGGSYLADLVSISHPRRGVGESPAYNAPPDDPDYDAGLVGLELGEILEEILTIDRVATDLWNVGIACYTDPPDDPAGYDTAGGDAPALKSATLTDFGLMTTVPLTTVRVSGQRLWSQVLDLVRTFAPTYRLRILPDGTIRCTDTRTLAPRTLTIGTDPIRIPRLSRDTSNCATAVRIRGRDDVEGMWFTLANGDLEEDWTPVEEADWTWADFVRPTAGYSSGDITSMGTDTVTVDPDDGLLTWADNYWAPLLAHITLIDDAASGNIQYQITRRVIANTGFVLTLDVDLPPSPGYDRYQLLGVADGSQVHRRYTFASGRQDAASRIVTRFPFPVATASLGTGYDGAIVTSVPFGWNVKASSTLATGQVFPLQFDLFTDPGDDEVKIITAEPTCKPHTPQSDLDIGGDVVTKPDDIRVFVPVSKGPLEVRVPAADDSPAFEGRAYDVDGLEFELTIDLDSWHYTGDLARAEAFAQDLLDSLKDPIISGAIEYVGFDATGVAASGIEAIKIATVAAFDDIDDDLDDVPLPVHSVEVRWNHAPGQPTTHTTVLNVNNRTFPYHGERQNEPRGYTEGGSLFGFGDAARAMGLFTGED
jgi:hypothetical protein